MAEILVKGKPWHYEATSYYNNDAKPIDKKDAAYLLKTIKNVLNEHGIIVMPVYGTLLGIIREHDFIGHDCDMDCMIWGKDRQAMINLIPELDAMGIKFTRCSEPWVYTFQYKGACCDIDAYGKAPWPYSYRYCLAEGKYMEKHFFENTEEIEFLGEMFTIPANPEKLLERYYGKDWRIPNSKHANGQSKLIVHALIWQFIKRSVSYVYRHFIKR